MCVKGSYRSDMMWKYSPRQTQEMLVPLLHLAFPISHILHQPGLGSFYLLKPRLNTIFETDGSFYPQVRFLHRDLNSPGEGSELSHLSPPNTEEAT